MVVAVESASASSSSKSYRGMVRPAEEEEDVGVKGKQQQQEVRKVKRRTLQAVLEQCQRALELLRDADLDHHPTATIRDEEDDDLEEEEEDDAEGNPLTTTAKRENDESSLGSQSDAAADSDTDELCDFLKSRVLSPNFLEKLESVHMSVLQNGSDESTSWDVVTATDLWAEKSIDGESKSTQDGDDYVLVRQEDIVDGIACFMAAYLLSLEQTKDLTPNQLQEALSKTFSVKKKEGKLRKAWDGSKVIYNVASWGATAIGIYQNPALLGAASAAFWTSCRVISRLF